MLVDECWKVKWDFLTIYLNFKIFYSSLREMTTTKIAFILLSTLLFVLPSNVLSKSLSKCPAMCRCDLDVTGRYYTLCENGNMTELPTSQIDEKMEIIIIHNPGSTITIGNIFSSFKKLEILRIIDSSVPAIGTVREDHFTSIIFIRSFMHLFIVSSINKQKTTNSIHSGESRH
jgi:hypothetical protein